MIVSAKHHHRALRTPVSMRSEKMKMVCHPNFLHWVTPVYGIVIIVGDWLDYQ